VAPPALDLEDADWAVESRLRATARVRRGGGDARSPSLAREGVDWSRKIAVVLTGDINDVVDVSTGDINDVVDDVLTGDARRGAEARASGAVFSSAEASEDSETSEDSESGLAVEPRPKSGEARRREAGGDAEAKQIGTAFSSLKSVVILGRFAGVFLSVCSMKTSSSSLLSSPSGRMSSSSSSWREREGGRKAPGGGTSGRRKLAAKPSKGESRGGNDEIMEVRKVVVAGVDGGVTFSHFQSPPERGVMVEKSKFHRLCCSMFKFCNSLVSQPETSPRFGRPNRHLLQLRWVFAGRFETRWRKRRFVGVDGANG